MGLLWYWRALLRYLSQKTIKTFILSILVISHLHVSEGVRWAPNGQPKDMSVVVGGQAKFNCTVEDLGNAQYIWNMGSSTIFLNGQRSALQGFDWSRYRIEGTNNLVIDNVQETDESSFACVIFGFDQVQVHLTVWVPPGPPVISQNYSGQLVENSVISLTCSSQGGKPAPTVRWLRNGQPVNSAKESSSSSQIVVDVSRQDHSANFSCLVYNEANQNSPLISTRILNVQYSPSIHFEPDYSPYKVKLNSPVSLRCVVDANPPAQRPQWRKNGSPIAVSGETLAFSAIQKSDSGEYTCSTSNLIQNQVKTASSSVTIDVIYAPIVTTQPILVANISTQVDMTCSVDANPPVTSVRWQKLDDNPIYASGPNFVFTASKRYIGNYSCTASSQLEPSGSPIEQVQSKGYTQLRIQYAPGQASISPTSSVLVGQPIMLTCTVDDPGYPNPNYEWRKAGSSQILQSTTSPVYRINSATLSDNGNYSCLPRNLMGRGTQATILVDVNSAPIFIKSTPNMDNFTVPINQSNLFLQHKIEGRPLPAVQWFKDGVPLSVMPKLFRIETTNSLSEYKYNVTTTVTFVGSDRNGQNSLRIEDMGNYTCQVMSSASTDTVSKSVFLSIEFKPKTSAAMTRVAADANVMEEAMLTCDIQSNPAPLFSWYKMVPGQNKRLYNGSKITITSQNDGIAKYMSYLKIKNTGQEDFGQYLCEVYNAKGQTSKTITLSPKDKPDPPTNLASISKTWESVNLRWVPGFNGGFGQTFFIHISSIYGERKEEVYPHASYKFNVTRLMPQTSYTFHVYGRNDRGQGKNSAGFTAQTDVLVFPPLKEIPEYRVEERSLNIPNDLNQSYCLRVEVSKDSGKVWTTAESCVPPSGKGVPLNLQTATNVNVSVCLVYRPEVCGEPVISKIHQASTPDLSAGQVVIIGCVCAAILIILLIILIVVLCRRRQRNKNYQQQQDPHSPRTVQQGNGVIPQKQPQRAYDNSTDGLQLDNRNGYPSQFHFNVDTSYDSQNYDSQYELEMNRRNANLIGDPYFEKQGDMSFNGSPRTPVKDPQQFINLPEDTHKREGGGSMGSGNESGYSTPDPAKPKKVIYEVVV